MSTQVKDTSEEATVTLFVTKRAAKLLISVRGLVKQKKNK